MYNSVQFFAVDTHLFCDLMANKFSNSVVIIDNNLHQIDKYSVTHSLHNNAASKSNRLISKYKPYVNDNTVLPVSGQHNPFLCSKLCLYIIL